MGRVAVPLLFCGLALFASDAVRQAASSPVEHVRSPARRPVHPRHRGAAASHLPLNHGPTSLCWRLWGLRGGGDGADDTGDSMDAEDAEVGGGDGAVSQQECEEEEDAEATKDGSDEGSDGAASAACAGASATGQRSSPEATLQDEGLVMGMRKGLVSQSSGGWLMEGLRRLCWYVLDVLVVESQRLRFAGHLLSAAGLVRSEKIPPTMKRRRGMWWRTSEQRQADGEGRKGLSSDAHVAAATGDDDDVGKYGKEEDGAGVADFLRRGISQAMGEPEAFSAAEVKFLKRRDKKARGAQVAEQEEWEEEEEEGGIAGQSRVLQAWPVPLEHFLPVGDCVRVVPKGKRPGARAVGLYPYVDPYQKDEEPPEEVLERLAVEQRDPAMRGRRLADPTLAAERFFSPAALQARSEVKISMANRENAY
jgi:hypothetical protein